MGFTPPPAQSGSKAVFTQLLSTRTKQPHYATRANRGVSMGRDLAFVLPGSFFDPVTRSVGVPYGSNVPAVDPPRITTGTYGRQITSTAPEYSATNGSAVQFDRGPVDVLGNGVPGTVHMLIRPRYQTCDLLGKSDGDTSDGWSLQFSGGQLGITVVNDGADFQMLTDASIIQLGSWQLISIVCTSSVPGNGEAVFYLNGNVFPATVLNNASGTHGSDATHPLLVGASVFNTAFSGDIAFLSMHRSAHIAQQVKSMVNNPWQVLR